jgi:glucose/arabinose dehydrogenase/mono/diheme cytochrome c family protein
VNLILTLLTINLSLLIYTNRFHVFVFPADWWEFVLWFVLWSASFYGLGLYLTRNRTQPVATIERFQTLIVGALTFKYLVASFLYEPFRAYFIYATYMGLMGAWSAGELLWKERKSLRLQASKETLKKIIKDLKRPPTVSLILVVTSLLVLLVKPTGFQGHYIHWVRDIKFALFNVQDTLPYALKPMGPGFNQLNQPLQVLADPLSPNHLIIVERPGVIKRIPLIEKNGETTILLDLSERLGELGAERALVAAEWHPKFPESPYIYIAYSHLAGTTYTNRLSRFTVSTDNQVQSISKDSEMIYIDSVDRHNWHNGGGLKFGPDGFLYYGVGDEGNNNDFHQNSQKITHNLFSGILRLDVDNQGPSISHPIVNRPKNGVTQGYHIPNSNPFVGVDGALEEFYAIGMRNPYRFSFDPQGNLWAIDVGQDRFEEINVVQAGGNYGWAYKEGPMPNSNSYLKGQKPTPYFGSEMDPFYFYPHSGAQICIVGGLHYTSEKFSPLKGKYIFADLSGEIYALTYEDQHVVGKELIAVAQNTGQGIAGMTLINDRIFVIALGAETEQSGAILELIVADKDHQQSAVRQVSIHEKYSQMCSRCHGANGKPAQQTGGVLPRDFTSPEWQSSTDDKKIAQVITEGGAAVGMSPQMPGWKNILNPDEVKLMIEKIRSFAPSPDGGSNQ